MKRKIYASFFMVLMLVNSFPLFASSHREAPLIADDPLADNTDVYAFRSPTNPNKIILMANYIPFQSPQGGPNFFSFGENIRYEIHVDNNTATPGDDITYRFTFKKINEDPTTFFNIRLGKQNIKTTYTLDRSTNGGASFQSIVTNGIVPPPNIGPRSISSGAGLNTPDYNTLINNSIATATSGERVFCGTADDPFFVDLGGIFDLGDAPRTTSTPQIDGLRVKNVSTIAIEVDISTLQKTGQPVSAATSILDPNYVIGVWASASRQQIRTLNAGAGTESTSGNWIQVSRLGMPLTNEAVIPIGMKDLWNSSTPYQDGANPAIFGNFFYNPELALYMDDRPPLTAFGSVVPALAPLRVQSSSLANPANTAPFPVAGFDFRNGMNGLFPLRGNPALIGTALAEPPLGFAHLLLPRAGAPRSLDLWPLFHTGVPNLSPYQLANVNGKGGNPLAPGKPFINNFLPNGGDMLRLNMAVPVTSRTDPKFSNLGLIQAVALAYTDPLFTNNTMQFIPNMDGFPNGRRLEDDVTRIELQAVGGIVLAAIGLFFDDYTQTVQGTPRGVTPKFLAELGYNTGINNNDTTFKTSFPFVQTPWPGVTARAGLQTNYNQPALLAPSGTGLGLSSPEVFYISSPNPVRDHNTITYRVLSNATDVKFYVTDALGRKVKLLLDAKKDAGIFTLKWNPSDLQAGVYFLNVIVNFQPQPTLKVVKL